HLTEASDEVVVGIEMVQAFGREDDVRERFTGRAEAVRAETMRQAGVEARFLPGLIFLGDVERADLGAVADNKRTVSPGLDPGVHGGSSA
ncbi:MAG: hypothetical protein ABWY00_08245, partial [Dongiaceae bacterium]